MRSFLENVFGRAPRGSIGAAWDGGRLMAARPAGEGGKTFFSAEAPDAVRSASVWARLKSEGFHGAPVTAVFPQHLLVVKTLDLPSADPAEVREMAALEASRRIPLPPEEILTDIHIVSTDSNGSSKVMLFAARREDVSRWLETFRAAGLAPERLEPSSLALAPLLRRAASAGETLLGLEAAAGAVTFVLFQDGVLRFVRSLPVSAEELETEAGGDRFSREVRDTLLACRREHTLSDTVRVLAGGSPGLFRLLPGVLPWPSEPFPGVPEGFLPSAVGAVLLPHDGSPNLLPPEDREGRVNRRRRRESVSFASLAAAGLVVATAWGAGELQAKKRRLSLLETRWSSVAGQVRELEKMESRLELIRRRAGTVGDLPQLVAALNKVLPPRVFLTGLNFERGISAELQGEATTLAEAVASVNALEKSGLFHKVKLISSNARPVNGRDLVEFRVHLSLGEESA